MKMQNRIIDFFKKETVFSISLILALISCLFAKPSIDFINWQTIGLLFSIMLIVEILKNLRVFEILSYRLLLNVTDTRNLVFILVFTCFLASIFLTNDVSLIIFVPFTLLVLKKVSRIDLAVLAVSLETLVANVGCMVLPIGAPHNIVMYTVSHISFVAFFELLLPYIAVSLIFLIIIIFLIKKEPVALIEFKKNKIDRDNFIRNVFRGVDYWLLLTFIALFIFIGNLEQITFFKEIFKNYIAGNEVLWGILASQIISNVPSAMLLSGFSSNYSSIIIGINIGGFGTLIASMANLISYKIIAREYKNLKIRYLIVFTILNVLMLLILSGLYIFMN